MKTPEEIEAFYNQLEAAGVSRTSSGAHCAKDNFKDGDDAEECIAVAVRRATQARNIWTEKFLDPWCARHGLTREQGLSVTFDDNSFNPANPEKDLVTQKDLFWGGGQHNDFVAHFRRERIAAKEQAPKALSLAN